MDSVQEIVRQRAASPQWRWLHALRCCGVVRASMNHAGLRSLVDSGYARRDYVAQFPTEKCDYSLTWAGQRISREVFDEGF